MKITSINLLVKKNTYLKYRSGGGWAEIEEKEKYRGGLWLQAAGIGEQENRGNEIENAKGGNLRKS